MYVIDPEIAIQYREEHLQKEPYNVKIKESILELVDNIIRTNHPFAQIYKRTDRLYKDEIQRRELEGEPDLPKFRVTLNIYTI